MRLFLFSLFMSLGLACAANADDRPVWLELVLAMDVSTSVDAREYELQQKGLGLAFADRDVIDAIEGSGGIAVSVVQWAGRGNVTQVLNWELVETGAEAVELGRRIAALPRAARGFTDIAGAINVSALSFADNGFRGVRQVIDVSGDGTATEINPSAARDAAVRAGIIVNGLVILNEDMDLGIMADEDTIGHYEQFVIGGPGAFLIVADGFEDFARAIREKLLREISGPLLSGVWPDSEVVRQ